MVVLTSKDTREMLLKINSDARGARLRGSATILIAFVLSRVATLILRYVYFTATYHTIVCLSLLPSLLLY